MVSGATRGIGRAIAEALLERGAQVVGVYGGNRGAAEAMAEDCGRFGDRLRLHQLDVSDFAAASAFFQALEAN